MASSLDRAVWLLSHRTDLWEQIGNEARELLMSQPAPHGEFFTWLDRLIHDLGTLSRGALLEELANASAPEALLQLCSRVGEFHEVAIGDETRRGIDVIVDRLRLGAVQRELDLLASSAELSEAARTRHRELLERQRYLKELVWPQPKPGVELRGQLPASVLNSGFDEKRSTDDN
jgi:hypothetical protein